MSCLIDARKLGFYPHHTLDAGCLCEWSVTCRQHDLWLSLLLFLFRHVWLCCNPMDGSLPGSSVHSCLLLSQARILEWVAISFSRGSSWLMDRTYIFCIGRWILHHWATREVLLLLSLVEGNSQRGFISEAQVTPILRSWENELLLKGIWQSPHCTH